MPRRLPRTALVTDMAMLPLEFDVRAMHMLTVVGRAERRRRPVT